MTRIVIVILLQKMKCLELVLVFYCYQKVSHAQPWNVKCLFIVWNLLELQEKVDEWISGLGKNMSSKETQQPNVFRFQQTNSETEPYNFSRKQANMYRPLWNQEKNEAEALMRRISKREEEEARREREQVLTGKLKPSETYIKADKVIQIQQKIQNIDLKSQKISVTKIKSLQ